MCFALQALKEMEHNASGMASQGDLFGRMEYAKGDGIEDASENFAKEIEGHRISGMWGTTEEDKVYGMRNKMDDMYGACSGKRQTPCWYKSDQTWKYFRSWWLNMDFIFNKTDSIIGIYKYIFLLFN